MSTRLEIRAAGAAWWSALEIMARYGTQFLVMVVLARLLAPEDFGIVAMLLVFTSIGALIVDSGFGTALIQRQRNSADDETTVFIFNVIAGLAIAAALIFLAPPIAAFFEQPKLLGLIRAMAIVLPLGALGAVPDALLTMRLNFRARARAEVISSLLSGVAAIMLALRGYGVWSLVWQAIIAIALRSLLLWLLSGWKPRGRYRQASFRSLFGFGGYLLLTGLLNAIAVRMQALLIGKLFDARELGYYTLAQNTQQAPTSLMGSILNRVGLPLFAAITTDRQKTTGALRSSLRMAMFLFVPCMVGIALVARPLIELLYGVRWAPAAPILSILALSAVLWPIHVLNLAAIGAQGKSNLLLRVEVVKQLAFIGLLVACAPRGPIAVAWAVLGGSILSVITNTYYSRKLLGYGALAQIADQFATFALSAISAAVGWAILHWTSPSLTTMAAAILAASVMYVALAVFTRNTAMTGLLSMLRALRSPSDMVEP